METIDSGAETTASACAYHPDRAAVDTCANCHAGICDECRGAELVAGQTICRRCHDAIRARIARELDMSDEETAMPRPEVAAGVGSAAAASSATGGTLPPGAYAPPPPPSSPAAPYPVTPPQQGVLPTAPPPLPPLHFGRMLAGIALGVLAGIVSVVIWVLFVYFSNFNISFFAIGVGWLVGMAVVKGCGQGGKVPAVIGAVLSLLMTGLAALIFSVGPTGFSLNFGWFGWLCIAIGVYEGYIVPLRAGMR